MTTSVLVVAAVVCSAFGRQQDNAVPLDQTMYLITGVAGPRGHAGGHGSAMSNNNAVHVLTNIEKLAFQLDASILIYEAEDVFLHASHVLNCTRCTVRKELPHVHHIKERTERLAVVRNQVLDDVLQINPTFWIVLDLDDASCTFNPDVFASIDDQPAASMLSFMPHDHFYDSWALRAPFFPYSTHGSLRYAQPFAVTVKAWLRAAQKMQVPYIKVWSSFNGAAVYRVCDVARSGCRYGYRDKDGAVDCEHAIFNQCIHRHGYELRWALRNTCL